MVRFVLWLLVLSAAPLQARAEQAADAPLFDAPTMSDTDLGAQRGGFALPGGVEVTLGVRITTDVNGQRLLETAFNVDAKAASASVRTADGTVTPLDPRGAAVVASLPGLTVEHVIGQRIASVVANSANNQVIDHQITVDLSLENVRVMSIGSAVFHVQSLGIDAGQWRALGG